uniref:Lipoprotein n=1 Tax=Anguilla anguilla TaxID=7936 RepID=A0A0E9S5Z7_ANGAN
MIANTFKYFKCVFVFFLIGLSCFPWPVDSIACPLLSISIFSVK